MDGVVLGGFALRQKIGEGGFGTVYLAEQQGLGRAAVVKVMRRSLAVRGDATERFELEARLACRLDHPCAAHIYAFGAEDDGTLWIAMELVKGTSLETLLESGPLSLERAIPMLERLCDAVQTAHAQGIVHRDIKPANVMVAAKAGRLMPKLLDFGIAKQLVASDVQLSEVPAVRVKRATRPPPQPMAALDHTAQPVSALDHTMPSAGSQTLAATVAATTPTLAATVAATTPTTSTAPATSLTQAGQILGSPPYMAPEQWIDPSLVGPWTDQYALALLAYEALSGKRACNGRSLAELAEQHLEAPLPRPPGISDAIHSVLARAAAKEPKDRYPDLDAFVAALRAATGWTDDAVEPVPGMRAELQAGWTADAPQPIAEAITALIAARSPNRVSERVMIVGRVIARWLGVLAIASRSRIGRIDSHTSPIADRLRDLRRRAPRDDEWIELAVGLGREFADSPETWPIPELAIWCADQGAIDALRELVRGEHTIADGDLGDRARAIRQIAALERILDGLGWLLDYEVGREVPSGVELWVGPRSDDRVIRKGPSDGDRVVVLDADGARVVLLAPLVVIAAPMAGEPEELFVFSGPSRTGAALHTTFPRGFERDDVGLWSWLADHVLETSESSEHTSLDERAPYPGLAAFTTSDHGSFVGREREATELVNRLRAQPIVAVVGPSGAGKSSFLAAGVIPTLPTGWQAITIRPGRDPLSILASIRTRVDASPYRDGHHSEPLEPSADLGAHLVATAARHAGTLVLIIDQAEELFTQGATDEQRVAFARAVIALSTSPHARVVLGVRDDFLCRVEELAPWRGVIAHSVQILGVPGRGDLERIVTEPARRLGYDFEDAALPAKMVDEVVDRPGALPLLSFAAAELWDRRDRHFKRITKLAYEQIGGVSGALVQHADGVVDRMTVVDRKLVRLAFRRLLTAEGARIVHGRSELVAALGGGPAASHIVERLLAARLIVSRDDDGGERVEIIHEALTRTWPRLDAWRQQDASGAKLHEQLVAAARHWAERDRPEGLLWRDAALADLRRWRSTNDRGLTPVEAAFAETSERVARRARRRKLVTVSAAFAVLASAVVVLGIMSQRISSQRSEAVRRVAAGFEERGRLAITSGENTYGLLYLAEAGRLGESGPVHDLLVARAAAAVEGFERIELRSPDPVDDAQWSRGAIVTIDPGGAARLWDRATRQLRTSIGRALVAEPVDDALATISLDGDVTLTAPTGELRWRAERVHAVAANVAGIVVGRHGLMVTYRGPTARLWALADGSARGALEHDGNVQTAVFDGDERRVAVAAGGEVRIWDVATATLLATCKTSANRLPGLTFTPANDRIVIGGADGTVRLCDAATGEVTHVLSGHLGVAHLVEIDRDGGVLVTASLDGTARLWTLATGEPIGVLAGHRGGIRTLELSPDGRSVATGGEDATIRIWDVESATQIASLEGHVGRITGLLWETQDRIESASHDGTIRRWNVARAKKHAIAHRHAATVESIQLSRDGALLTYGRDATAIVWDPTTLAHRAAVPDQQTIASVAWVDPSRVVAVVEGGRVVVDRAALATGDREVIGVAASPDGRVIATSSSDGVVRLWGADGATRGAIDVGFPSDLLSFDPSGRWLTVRPDFSRTVGVSVIEVSTAREAARLAAGTTVYALDIDDTRLAIAANHDVVVFELGTWSARSTLGHRSSVNAVVLASDERVVTAGSDATVAVWDRQGRVVATLPGRGGGSALDVSEDGHWLAIGRMDGAVDVWELAGYRMVVSMRGHRLFVLAVKFARDGKRVFSTGQDGRVASWDLDRPTRTQAELARLVKCRVPLRLDGETAIPREIDFDDPSCR
ncbi:MAG: protein kinase [Myxococcota bacterium]|nr:protein kinase [Myxococcota bacterium]